MLCLEGTRIGLAAALLDLTILPFPIQPIDWVILCTGDLLRDALNEFGFISYSVSSLLSS